MATLPHPPRCPRCEFSYGWDGKFCSHCHRPYPLRTSWAACTEPEWFDRHHASVPRRKLVLFGCACARTVLRFLPYPAAEELVARLESAADRGVRVPGSAFELARRLRERVHAETPPNAPARPAADALAQLTEVATGSDPYGVFHAVRSAAAAAALEAVPETPDEEPARPAFLDDPTRPRAGSELWHLPTDMTPAENEQHRRWQEAMARAGRVRTDRARAASAATAAACDLYRDVVAYPFEPQPFDADWRTSTAVALARGMSESRDFSPMPILADALQDAGCDDDHVLNHCRGTGPHVPGCWVVDLVLGTAG
jgi:hypothetical protein